MDLQLYGKTAIVTGASMGLGRATSKALAAEGVKVFAVSRTQALLDSLADEIRAAGGPAGRRRGTRPRRTGTRVTR